MFSPALLLPVLLATLPIPRCWAYPPTQNLPACTKTPPGSQFTCGQKGTVKPPNGPQFTYHNVTSVAACHLECLHQTKFVPEMEISVPSCYGIGYNAQAQTCTGYFKIAKQISFTQNASSPTVFYDTQCFMCIYDTPPPQGSTLLANGGFQNPTSSNTPFSPWVGSGETVVSPGFQSTKGLQNFPNSSLFVVQNFIDPVRGYYDFTFDYKFQAVDSTPVRVHPFTSESLNQYPYDSHLMQPANVKNNTWSTFKGTMQLGPYTSQTGQPWYDRIQSANVDAVQAGITFEIDNVKITPAQLPFQAKQGAPNLIKNGGFESGSLQGFNVKYHGPDVNGAQNQTISFVPSGASGSNYALQFDPSKIKLGIQGFYFQLSQNVPVKDGVDYLVGMTYRVVKGDSDCANNLTTSKEYVVESTVADLVGINNNKVHNQTGTSFDFRTSSFDNTEYVTYQLPLPSYSSYTRRSTSKFTFTFEFCCGDVSPGCPLLVDEVFIRERA